METLSPSVIAYRQKKAEEDKLRREKNILRSKEWRKENPERSHNNERRSHLKRNFNISPEQYDEMFKAQDGKCAICSTTKLKKGCNYLHIDHNHKTKEIRKLLCDKCNRGLGYFNHDIELLKKAIAYLEGSK